MNNRVAELVCLIVKAKKAYYTSGSPIMTDYQYDMLEAELLKLDPDHPILSCVGYGERYDWWLTHYGDSNV